MLLTVSKRLEFSASRQLHVRSWSDAKNLAVFGPETNASYGTGRNYVAYFVFTGPVDQSNGMLINISQIKERAGRIVRVRFDHKFLNKDNPSFRDIATFYSNGIGEANYWFEFSAARKTMSPLLSGEENTRLFGPATSPHGHNYRARFTFRTKKLDPEVPLVRYDAIDGCLCSLRDELDHRYLNQNVAGLKNRPITTESLAGYLYERVNAMMPLHRVRLHEREDFFSEVWDDDAVFLGMRVAFNAAHRLHAVALSDAKNAALYGKCNNPLGHGHRYLTETTVGGEYDRRSGTLYDFVEFRRAIEESLVPWRDRHLDLETEDFRDVPSTGENIVSALWPKIDSRLGQQLVRLRLWETANNRFTLRRT